jgi:hypothetical protein
LRGLDVVGEGPLVPCLPLVTAVGYGPTVSTIRRAVAAACHDARAKGPLARQLIDHFVPLDASDYRCVTELVVGLSLDPPAWPLTGNAPRWVDVTRGSRVEEGRQAR